VLALEASTLRPGAALLGPDGERWGCWTEPSGRRGTATLAAAAGELLSAAGLSARELLGVVVGTGPGSYTGTRSAIALARGLCFAADVRLAGVPSVAAAARGALVADPALQRVVVLVDARRGESYRADYERAAGRSPSDDPLWRAGLIERAPPRLVAARDTDVEELPDISLIREPVPDPYDVAAVGRERLLAGGDDPAAVLPLYLKRSHAEIVFDERVGPQGLGGG
jgi:tRNA threonylcarbamoyl adenosine modification protein YeaZ